MKKLLKMMLLAIMLCAVTFTITGCGNDEDTQNQEQQENVQENEQNNEESNNDNFSRGEWI